MDAGNSRKPRLRPRITPARCACSLPAAAVVCFAGAVCLAGPAIKSDEQVVFFPTYGALTPDGSTWVIGIHGWIYEPEERSIRRRLALGQFRRFLGVRENEPANKVFTRRARLFLVDNERNKHVEIQLGPKRYAIGSSAPDGHFRGTLRLPVGEVEAMRPSHVTGDGRLTFKAVTRRGDEREFTGTVHLIGRTGVSVISDIDDTVKVSQVNDREALMANTLLRRFEAVPGMAELYDRWAEGGARFHYVTSSPWQLYDPLSSFLRSADFPDGTYHMKSFRWKNAGIMALFASPEITKRGDIEMILAAFPQRRFILVGDSGEKDPELYGTLGKAHPEQVERILIRNVTGERPDNPRFREAFAGIPQDRWLLFSDDDLPHLRDLAERWAGPPAAGRSAPHAPQKGPSPAGAADHPG